MDKQTKHPGHVLMLVQFARFRPGHMSRCLLPACSASPFATLSAARIGYVECPFNGLNTHTQTHSNAERIASFYKPFRACTRVPRRLIAMNCCRMIFILFPLSVCASFVSFAVTGTS